MQFSASNSSARIGISTLNPWTQQPIAVSTVTTTTATTTSQRQSTGNNFSRKIPSSSNRFVPTFTSRVQDAMDTSSQAIFQIKSSSSIGSPMKSTRRSTFNSQSMQWPSDTYVLDARKKQLPTIILQKDVSDTQVSSPANRNYLAGDGSGGDGEAIAVIVNNGYSCKQSINEKKKMSLPQAVGFNDNSKGRRTTKPEILIQTQEDQSPLFVFSNHSNRESLGDVERSSNDLTDLGALGVHLETQHQGSDKKIVIIKDRFVNTEKQMKVILRKHSTKDITNFNGAVEPITSNPSSACIHPKSRGRGSDSALTEPKQGILSKQARAGSLQISGAASVRMNFSQIKFSNTLQGSSGYQADVLNRLGTSSQKRVIINSYDARKPQTASATSRGSNGGGSSFRVSKSNFGQMNTRANLQQQTPIQGDGISKEKFKRFDEKESAITLINITEFRTCRGGSNGNFKRDTQDNLLQPPASHLGRTRSFLKIEPTTPIAAIPSIRPFFLNTDSQDYDSFSPLKLPPHSHLQLSPQKPPSQGRNEGLSPGKTTKAISFQIHDGSRNDTIRNNEDERAQSSSSQRQNQVEKQDERIQTPQMTSDRQILIQQAVTPSSRHGILKNFSSAATQSPSRSSEKGQRNRKSLIMEDSQELSTEKAGGSSESSEDDHTNTATKGSISALRKAAAAQQAANGGIKNIEKELLDFKVQNQRKHQSEVAQLISTIQNNAMENIAARETRLKQTQVFKMEKRKSKIFEDTKLQRMRQFEANLFSAKHKNEYEGRDINELEEEFSEGGKFSQKNFNNLRVNKNQKRSRQQLREIFRNTIRLVIRLNINPEEAKSTKIFSSKPFEKENSRQLFEYLKADDVEQVNLLLVANKYLVYDYDYLFLTPLHWACKRGMLQMAELLIKFNSDIDAEDMMGRTPLSFAVENNFEDIVELLLINRANPNKSKYVDYKSIAKSYVMQKMIITARRIYVQVKFASVENKNELYRKEIAVLPMVRQQYKLQQIKLLEAAKAAEKERKERDLQQHAD